MKSVALRFGDAFAPPCGTIKAHERILKKKGYVWYGKIGLGISPKGVKAMLDSHKMLLIHSGKMDRYWLTVSEVSNKMPAQGDYPDYYGDKTNHINTWIKVIGIEQAPGDILSACRLVSNNRPLADVSKTSMSPFFIIECNL